MAGLEDRWFEQLFDAIDQYTWILDSQGNVVKVNRAARELMNDSQENILGTPLDSAPWQGLSRQNRRILKWVVNQAMNGRPASHDLDFHQRGQPGMVINLTGKPVLPGNGSNKFHLIEGRDITAYKQTSAALNQMAARFQTIFEQAEMGILIKDIDGKMLDCNPAFRSMLGYTAEDISRLAYLDITYSADKRRSQKLFQELVNGKRKSYLIEKRYLHKDGHLIWMRIAASLVLESDHQAQFVIAMAENIHSQKVIEDELSELQRRLMHGREMERLGIAQELHDGPLQDLMDVTYQIHEIEETISDIDAQEKLKKLQVTINQLARSIRMICGELRPPTLAPFGLGKTITSHAIQFQESHPELKIKLNLMDDGQSLSEPVRIVLFRIYQAALNNILRHAQATTVKIQFKLNKDRAVLKIQDNGRGFNLPARWITLARQGHLGIVGARERANEVGGDLKVLSSPGKGTVIQAVVPVKEEFTEAFPLEEKI